MTPEALLPVPAAWSGAGPQVRIGIGHAIGVRGPEELLAAVLPGTTALARRVRDLTVHGAHHGPAVQVSLTQDRPGPATVGVSPTGAPLDEGYTLHLVDGVAHLAAATATGIFRGLTTVVQLPARQPHPTGADLGQLRDAPLLAWRELSLDVAR